MLWRSLGDGNRLAEFARGFDIIYAATLDPSFSENCALLPASPTMAETGCNTVFKLQRSGDGQWECFTHNVERCQLMKKDGHERFMTREGI